MVKVKKKINQKFPTVKIKETKKAKFLTDKIKSRMQHVPRWFLTDEDPADAKLWLSDIPNNTQTQSGAVWTEGWSWATPELTAPAPACFRQGSFPDSQLHHKFFSKMQKRAEESGSHI